MSWRTLIFIILTVMGGLAGLAEGKAGDEVAKPIRVAICGRRNIVRSWLPLQKQYGIEITPIPAHSLAAHFGWYGDFVPWEPWLKERFFRVLQGDEGKTDVLILPLRKVDPQR